MVGKRGRGGLFLGEPRLPITNGPKEATERFAARSASQRVRKYWFNSSRLLARRDRGWRIGGLDGPDGALGVRLFVATSRHAAKRLEDVVAGQRVAYRGWSRRSRPRRTKVATVLGLSHQTSFGTAWKNSRTR